MDLRGVRISRFLNRIVNKSLELVNIFLRHALTKKIVLYRYAFSLRIIRRCLKIQTFTYTSIYVILMGSRGGPPEGPIAVPKFGN